MPVDAVRIAAADAGTRPAAARPCEQRRARPARRPPAELLVAQ
jgi:hypothetical protein